MGMWAPLLLIGESTNESSSSNAGKRPLTRLDARLDAKKERRRGLSFVLRLSYLSVTRVQLTYLILKVPAKSSFWSKSPRLQKVLDCCSSPVTVRNYENGLCILPRSR